MKTEFRVMTQTRPSNSDVKCATRYHTPAVAGNRKRDLDFRFRG